jgi:hypothetical protein
MAGKFLTCTLVSRSFLREPARKFDEFHFKCDLMKTLTITSEEVSSGMKSGGITTSR